MSTTVTTTRSPSSEPPINQLLPLISQSASFLLSSIPVITSTLFSVFSTLVSFVSPIPIILYALAPVIVFFQIAVGLLVVAPYKLAIYFFDSVYPIYVFFGVACITGSVIGFGGRSLAVFLTAFLLRSNNPAVTPAVVVENGQVDDEKPRQPISSRLPIDSP